MVRYPCLMYRRRAMANLIHVDRDVHKDTMAVAFPGGGSPLCNLMEVKHE